jgi:methionine--tRNA ligase beta chain
MTIDEFKQADLRVGKVLKAEPVAGSGKLLRLEVDLGELNDGAPKPRQIISGIAKAYTPDELIGKQVVIIANLDPRMMMGLESQGMLLAASDAEGKPVALTLEKYIAPGTRVT